MKDLVRSDRRAAAPLGDPSRVSEHVREPAGVAEGEPDLWAALHRAFAEVERLRVLIDQGREEAYREGFADAERAMAVRHWDYVRGNVIASLKAGFEALHPEPEAGSRTADPAHGKGGCKSEATSLPTEQKPALSEASR